MTYRKMSLFVTLSDLSRLIPAEPRPVASSVRDITSILLYW